ncbi:MAG: hypothetical protein PHO94_13975, partial [Petrimonas sp.]|nr:hypothetical protein [Petrimonas sp.]
MDRFLKRAGIFPLLIGLLASLPLVAASPYFEIIKPSAKSVSDEGHVSVVIKSLDPAITKIGITDANGTEVFETIVPKRNVYCRSLILSMGENRLRITAYHGEENIHDESVSVYYRSEIFSGFQEEPAGYKKRVFHAEMNEQLCTRCHVMTQKSGKEGEAPDNPEDSVCYQCHKEMLSQGKAHAPAVNWMCQTCHNGKNGEYDE